MILTHICCAICWAKTLEGLRGLYGADTAVTGYWYNPNIHPLLEYRRRLKALQVYNERDPVPLEIVDEYGLSCFCSAIHPNYDLPQRCEVCYDMRFEKAAAKAAELGCAEYTSTLVTSRHQDHQRIRRIGEAAGERHGVRFLYQDFRQVEPPAKRLNGLYHQQYCGCVFSEYDRYQDTTKHLYRGPGS